MSHNDRQMNGQPRPNSILDQLELPPPRKDKQRLARLRTAWRESWDEGGFLYQRWEEVFRARRGSWHEVANFLQTLTYLMRHGPVERTGLTHLNSGCQKWGAGPSSSFVPEQPWRPPLRANGGA